MLRLSKRLEAELTLCQPCLLLHLAHLRLRHAATLSLLQYPERVLEGPFAALLALCHDLLLTEQRLTGEFRKLRGGVAALGQQSQLLQLSF